jgi:RNA polymerase-binding transcription factor DksA
MATRKSDSTKSSSTTATKGKRGRPPKSKPETTEASPAPVENNLKDQLTRLTSRKRFSSKGASNKKAQLLVFTVEEAREELERIRILKEEKLKEQESLKPSVQSTASTASPKTDTANIPRQVMAASIFDILGFDPSVTSSESFEANEREKVPQKWMEFYDSLVELRKHFKQELEIHTKDSLALDGSEESSKYTGYGSEQTDSDSGQFDREIALNMLAHEQDALFEVEEAIRRIIKDQYGVCEITGKAIKKQRLRAVPFTRYSIEGQQELEQRSRYGFRKNDSFLERDDDAPKLMASDEDDD